MTTIAFKSPCMAADRRTIGYMHVQAHERTKIVRRADGALCGTCGCASIGAAFARWFLDGEPATKPSLGDEHEDAMAIIARPNGDVEIHDRMGWTLAEGPFFALGTGAHLAIGAMAAGVSAADAVQIAARWGVGDPLSIDVLYLNRDESVIPFATQLG